MATLLQTTDLTGIRLIDDQHDELLGLVNLLSDAVATGERQHIGRCLDALLASALEHFEFEEQLMEQSGYPFTRVHKRLHDYFVQRLAEHTQHHDAGNALTTEMLAFLKSWLQNHFTHEDRDYSPQVLAELSGFEPVLEAANSHSGWFSRARQRFA